MPEETAIDRTKTALVVIDLQKGIVSVPGRPYSAQDVVANAAKLVSAFREKGMPVFLVHVDMTKETMLDAISDQVVNMPMPAPKDWSEFVDESTARFTYEYGYQQIFAEDAMTSRSEEQHSAAVNFIFKRIGRVRKTGEILSLILQAIDRSA